MKRDVDLLLPQLGRAPLVPGALDPTVAVYWRFRRCTDPAAASSPHVGLLAFRFDALRVAVLFSCFAAIGRLTTAAR